MIGMPNKNKACPCNSNLKYKKCCDMKHTKRRVQTIEAIEALLKEEEEKDNSKAG